MAGNNTQEEKKVYEKYFGALAASEYLIKEKNGFRLEDKHTENAKAILSGIYHGDTLVEYLGSNESLSTNPQAVAGAVKFFSEQTEFALQQEKTGNLYSFFQNSLGKKVSSEIKEKIQYLFNLSKDKVFGEILKEYSEAIKTINELKDKKDFEKDKDYKEAKSVFEKYSPLIETYDAMRSTKMEYERFKAISNANNRGLEKIVQDVKLPEPGKK